MKSLAPWLAVFLLAWAGVAQATAWFWRPATGGPYGARDGRSHADAWHSSDRIAWEQIAPGDVLYVCGMHDGGGADGILRVGTSGTADRPVTISGDCPGDPGTILAGVGRWRGGWVGPDALGIYSRQHAGSSGQLLDERGIVTRRKGVPDGSWPCPSFSQVGRTVYYKPCGAPGPVYADGRSPVIRVAGRDFIHIDRLAVRNASKLVEVTDARGFSITGSDLRFAAGPAILVLGKTADGTIAGNHVRDAGYGVYFVTGRGDNGNAHDNWIVEDNHIHDVYGSIDAHCIGLQAGSNNVIRRNELHDCEGSAITFYDPGRGARLAGNVVEHNVIHDIHATGRGGANQRGIEVNGHNCPRHPDDAIGNVIRNNDIRAVDHAGVYLKSGRPTAPGTFSWAVIDNTISEVGDGVLWVDSSRYGVARGKAANPCEPANIVPELSRPGFLLAGNRISAVRGSFILPKAVNPRLQSGDLAGVEIRGNRYSGPGLFVWQERGVRCRGAWDESLNRCTADNLRDFQIASGRDQGSTHADLP